MSDLVLITPAASYPITLSEAKIQCGFGPDDDADHVRSAQIAQRLRGKIAAATRAVENQLGVALMTQMWQLTLDQFPRYSRGYTNSGRPEIWLPKPPLQQLVSFKYQDTTGATLIVDPATYSVLSGGDSASRLALNFAQWWPVTIPQPGAVQIQFTCGYASPSAVPGTVKDALLMMVEFLNNVKGENAPMPQAIKDLLSGEFNYLS